MDLILQDLESRKPPKGVFCYLTQTGKNLSEAEIIIFKAPLTKGIFGRPKDKSYFRSLAIMYQYSLVIPI